MESSKTFVAARSVFYECSDFGHENPTFERELPKKKIFFKMYLPIKSSGF
jgi:hypothetical protein